MTPPRRRSRREVLVYDHRLRVAAQEVLRVPERPSEQLLDAIRDQLEDQLDRVLADDFPRSIRVVIF